MTRIDRFSPAALESVLVDSLVLAPNAKIAIAVSGGMDSMVLLQALAQLTSHPRRGNSFSLRAIHVHHGLHPDADAWQRLVCEACDALGVSMHAERVTVNPDGRGLEGAAREARYAAFARTLESDEVLVTAHHEDDQAETFVLRALRGGGAHALGSIRPRRTIFGIDTARPLLGFSRAALAAWANEHNLSWVEDPSNADVSLDRNYLRERILPGLDARYENATRRLAKAAGQAAEDAGLLNALAEIDLATVAVANAPSAIAAEVALDCAQLRKLDSPRVRNALRCWLRTNTGEVPGGRRLEEIEGALVRGSATGGEVTFGGVAVRRFDDRLYLDAADNAPFETENNVPWHPGDSIELPGTGLKLVCQQVHGEGIDTLRAASLLLRARRGSDRLRMTGGGPSRSLKNLYQERGIPPWQRERLPVLAAGPNQEPVAVPGVGVCARWRAAADVPGWVVRVEPA